MAILLIFLKSIPTEYESQDPFKNQKIKGIHAKRPLRVFFNEDKFVYNAQKGANVQLPYNDDNVVMRYLETSLISDWEKNHTPSNDKQ